MTKDVEKYALKICEKAHCSFKQDFSRVSFIIKKLSDSYGPEWNCITGVNSKVSWVSYCEDYENGLTVEINDTMYSIYQL